MFKNFLLCCFIGCSLSGIGQSIGIGTDYPDAQAILHIHSTDRGIFIPRMTTAQRDANITPLINTTDEGLLLYNFDDSAFNYWDGTQWIVFPSLLSGNDDDWYEALTVTSPNAIGDNIYTNGNVGIGTNDPQYSLDIFGDLRVEGGGAGHNIYGGAVGSIFIRTNSGLAIDLEEDGGSSGYFRIRNNADQNVFRVDHSGLTTIDNDLVFESTGNQIRFEGSSPVDIFLNTADNNAGLDIESQGGIDMVLDRDNSSTGASFTIKRNDDGTAAVNTLFTVPEDQTPLVYPYGIGSGETGGIRFRELEANGSDYIRLRAPNALSGAVNLTLPNTDGNNGEVLTTDGSGILSWSVAGGSDDDWYTIGGVNAPTNINDNIYTLGGVTIGDNTNAAPTNGLRSIGDVRIGYTGNAPASTPAVGSNAKLQVLATTNGDNGIFVHSQGNIGSGRGPTGVTAISEQYLGVFGISYNNGTNGYVSAGGYFAAIGSDADRVGVVGTTEVNGSGVPVYINSGFKNGVAGHSTGSGYAIYGNNTSAAGWALFAEGDAGTTSNAWTPSDKNLKQKISAIPTGLSIIHQLNPVSYQFIDGIGFPEGKKYGFLSQEVQQVVPELVKKKLLPQPTLMSANETQRIYTNIRPE
ncbi:MAG: tail fiber domain-containing protein, partial [Bacteroidetes bacterium]|nr:tail fiber domain-containing protein [Bacteroidota bacterium]